MTAKIPVTVLGATGVVGQRFVRRLANHPLFRVEHLAASERSAGKRYRDACAWRLDGEPYGGLGDQVMAEGTPEFALSPVVFSALDTAPAAELEPAFARAGAMVFSNAAAFRMSPEVPLLVPEVNADHLGLLEIQRHHHGWSGGIITNANCTATVLVMALAALHETFGVEAVLMTSMQAISGAGYPGVASLDILGNVIPFIRNEEPKVEEETPKMLGRFTGKGVELAGMQVSALCHRVPVIEGHTEAVSVRLKGAPSIEDVRDAWLAWRPEPQRLKLPSAPAVPVHVHTLEDRPQVRRDVEVDEGMSVHVGRLRPCPILGLKFALLGHNTERGAAGGSILNAELAHAKGYLR
ncbi:MAG TPA: aspartate-semialdehyde dehydrogenase [Geothrix sp.]|nr:aspartate-semialdehyde dehydrogenase [Geothrix sp.]